MIAIDPVVALALPLVEVATDASRFGPGEIVAMILGAGIALAIALIGISRSRERSYTTTPTLPAALPDREPTPGADKPAS